MSAYKPLETKAETDFTLKCKNAGYESIKIHKPGWPDRLVVLNYGYMFYIEFKREGKEPRPLQLHIHNKLRTRGIRVYVCDTLPEAMAAMVNELVNAQKVKRVLKR